MLVQLGTRKGLAWLDGAREGRQEEGEVRAVGKQILIPHVTLYLRLQWGVRVWGRGMTPAALKGSLDYCGIEERSWDREFQGEDLRLEETLG